MKYLVVSVHDICPRYQKELEVILSALNKIKLFKRNLLVVPNW